MIRSRPDGRERPSLRWFAAGLAVALAAGVGGWAIAEGIAADPAPVASAQKVVDAGPAWLRVSGDWARAARPPALPGLGTPPAYHPYAGLATTVSVALVPPDSATLVPAALAERAGGLPKAETARVVGLQARAYRGVQTGDSVLDVYAIPTTRGVLTLVCTARNGGQEAPTWCLEGLEQITVERAHPIALDAGTAYRMRAPAVLKQLDAARVRSRAELRQAKGPVGQGLAAKDLWRAYVAAADRLAPLAVPDQPSVRVVASLRDAARAYRALGVAADRRSTRAWRRASTTVSRAEQTLKTRVEAT